MFNHIQPHGIHVKVNSNASLRETYLWLDNNGLVLGDDYEFLGYDGRTPIFSFTDEQRAMMFKLTWGGM